MYYFAKFDSKGEIDIISISEYKTETETENAYYVSEEECLQLKKQIAERIEAENKAGEEEISPEEFMSLLEEAL